MPPIELNKFTDIIIGVAIEIHRKLGPGLLESAYTRALIREFELRHIKTQKQVPVELVYKETPLGKVYVIDILIEDEIIIEIKSVENILPIFIFQVITYLKITDKNLGYLINFNVPLLKDGFKRIVHNF